MAWQASYAFRRGLKRYDREITDESGRVVAIVPPNASQEQQEREADLIVAAPILLDAARDALDLLNGIRIDRMTLRQRLTATKLRAAIAVVEGSGDAR